VTPNVDHVVQTEHNDDLQAAYEAASLSLVDGQPLLWLSRLMGEPLPEEISGSDFVPRLCLKGARRGRHTFFLGASEGVAADAAEELESKAPSLRVTVHSPSFGFEQDREEHDAVLELVRDATLR
jgi:N-acetylglucosaminyldiphosphoundecaprenol N-acetyl-beta-D-mannosaminyltransferase